MLSKKIRTELAEIVRKYDLFIKDDNLATHTQPITEEEIQLIKGRKQELIEYLTVKNKSSNEIIPGLKEICDADLALEIWYYKFNKNMEDEYNSPFLEPQPQFDRKAALEQYPIASAYLKAEKYALSRDYAQAAIGQEALEDLQFEPENYEFIIENMKKKISDLVNKRLEWD